MNMSSKNIRKHVEGKRVRGFSAAWFDGERYQVRNGWLLAACEGEAHSNPHIDNCGRCAPFWGVVAVLP